MAQVRGPAPRWAAICRAGGAAAMVAAAGVHLQLWATGYGDVAVIGPLFLADAVASCGVAAAVLVSRHPLAAAVGIAIQLGAIAGLALASTTGLFGFNEHGTGVGVQIALAYLTESLGAVLLAASVVRDPLRGRIMGGFLGR